MKLKRWFYNIDFGTGMQPVGSFVVPAGLSTKRAKELIHRKVSAKHALPVFARVQVCEINSATGKVPPLEVSK